MLKSKLGWLPLTLIVGAQIFPLGYLALGPDDLYTYTIESHPWYIYSVGDNQPETHVNLILY